ncbi:MAG: hypothetical protein ACXWNK_18115 [Vulcanimicrobiaceae bacterium]
MNRILLVAGALCAASIWSGCSAQGARSTTYRTVHHSSRETSHSRAVSFIKAVAPLPIATAQIRERSEAVCAGDHATTARPKDAPALASAFDDVLGGSATITVYVDARGRPIAEDVSSYSDDGFRTAASRMLAGWPFVPARCDGRPVAGRYVVRFNA